MELSVQEFVLQLREAIKTPFPQGEIRIVEMNSLRLKARVLLSDVAFIDVFYGHSRQRIDFALIHQGQRVFGIDNLGGWHRHPLKKEREHEVIDSLSIHAILSQMRQSLQEINGA